MNVAIIPARGGSKRIPRKNIKIFAGKPIIAFSIEAALASDLFERVIVSTDDVDIASVAERYGAEVPFARPSHLADNHTGTNAVVRHALRWLNDHGEYPEFACCIYATAPFLHSRFLRLGFEELVSSQSSFAFSVTTFPYPVQRALRITHEGRIEPFNPEHIHTRSQDLEEAYHDAGQFYWGRADAFLNETVLFAPTSLPVVLPRYLVQDVDTQEDWDRAELMYQAWHCMPGGWVR